LILLDGDFENGLNFTLKDTLSATIFIGLQRGWKAMAKTALVSEGDQSWLGIIFNFFFLLRSYYKRPKIRRNFYERTQEKSRMDDFWAGHS
jgi:hypothetical protein